MKKVYIAMSTDIIHEGHINVINKGSEYGEVIIGLLSDKAISEYKRIPLLSFNDPSTQAFRLTCRDRCAPTL